MLRLVLQLALVALVLCALGCNKQATAKAKAEETGRKIGAGGMGSTEAPEGYIPPGQEKVNSNPEAATSPGMPTDIAMLLRQDVAAGFEKIGYSYNANMATIGGKGIPENGMSIEPVVAELYSKLSGMGDPKDAKLRGPAVDETVAKVDKMLQEGIKSRASGKPAPAPETSAEPADPRPATELRFCDDPVGDWRSVREVQDADREVMVEHSPDYYKLLLVNYSGLCTTQTYRNNKLELEEKHNWRYDRATGLLSIIADDGSTLEQRLIMDRPSEKNMIYVKNSEEYHYTLYERIGYGGRPRTKENLAQDLKDFEEAKRRLSGDDGKGRAKPGDNKGKGSGGDKGKSGSGK